MSLTTHPSLPSLLQLQRMDMEARSFSPEKSRQMLAKVKEYKGDLAKLREDAKNAAASGADTRCADPARSAH